MRAFILALALSLPLGLAACADSPQEEAIEDGAPAGDMEDVIGDGEIIDEPGEPEGNALDDDMDGDVMDDMESDMDAMEDSLDASMDGDMDGDGM